jgi:tetratricopeptide (TPR) repeat protein
VAAPAPEAASAPASVAVVAPAARRRLPVVVDYDAPPRRKAAPAPAAKAAPGADLEAAREAYREANRHYWFGQFAPAEQYYRKAIADYPGYAAGYRGLGLLHQRRGDRQRAIEAFTRYLKMAPGARDGDQIRERLQKLRAP